MIQISSRLTIGALLWIGAVSAAFTETNTNDIVERAIDTCLLSQIESESEKTRIETIKEYCKKEVQRESEYRILSGSISRRIANERRTYWNRHSIAAHDQNYILPLLYSDRPNSDVYRPDNDWADQLKSSEVKFQLSLKTPLTTRGIFNRYDSVYFGLTITAWWQLYARQISSPFRETNYRPELFYLTPLKLHIADGNTGFQVGMIHESNGRSQLLSRSWNRLYATILYERGDFAVQFRPWYRIPESAKREPLDSKGDDNPDIQRYLGYFDIKGAFRFRESELSFLFRNNLNANNRGAVEIGYSIPLSGNLKWFIQYFNGYGESLIDYDHRQQRLGIGILLTDWL